MKRNQKLLTLNDLYQFFLENNITIFSASNDNAEIIVSIPATYEIKQMSQDDDRALYFHLKACHTQDNLNKSFISDESMESALPSLYNRPILAAFTQDKNGNWDFDGHNMEIIDDPFNEGEQRVNYIERMVGLIPESAKLSLESEEGSDKKYVHAEGCFIYTDYGNFTADILKNREQVACSVELSIDKASFNAKEKLLNIEAFKFLGCTLLGTNIKPGMAGSNASLQYTSQSGLETYEVQMIELLDKLNTTLSSFNINNAEEGGNKSVTFEELLTKYGVTAENVTFEYENLSVEELEAKFAEVFDATKTDEGSASDDEDDTEDSDEEDSDEEDATTNSRKRKKCSIENDIMTISYELSHDDIRYALYNLISQYDEIDNEYYGIAAVYDDHFVMIGWCQGKYYGQAYEKDGDNVTLVGERYALHNELLTDTEYAELQNMRSQYSEIVRKLDSYESTHKETILNDKAYDKIADTDTFKELLENKDKYSIEDLQMKADLALAKFVKENETFSFNSKSKSTRKLNYGLEKPETKSSFLDGLLKKNM
jgi:hypothetical protein|nr:MAG TPA: hypothetical protein [Caudoviricetes sp.]